MLEPNWVSRSLEYDYRVYLVFSIALFTDLDCEV